MGEHILFNDFDICRLGFGCWQMAGDYNMSGRPNGYGAINTTEVIKAVHIALDNGINFFDTAIAYGFGRSEEVLGAALRAYKGASSRKPLICTKFGIVLGGNDEDEDFTAQNLTKSVEGSLKRLQMERLGVVLLHNPPDDFDFSKYDITPFEKLVQDGKIMMYGVSCKTQKGVANVINNGFGSAIEAVYNPLDRRYENYFSDPLYKDRYLFICRVPLASGFLNSSALLHDRVFSGNDIRHNFNAEQIKWVSESVRKLSFLNDLEGGMAVSALRFQFSNPYNTITIPGLKNPQHAEDAVLAMHLGPLPADVINKIAQAVPEVYYKWR